VKSFSNSHNIFQLLYSLPVGLNKLDDLSALQAEMKKHGGTVRILLDHLDQAKYLEEYETKQKHRKTWSAFIKIDDGGKYVQ
jgi:D-serine deaminase-like pyridoxal phosphate-dependent protein